MPFSVWEALGEALPKAFMLGSKHGVGSPRIFKIGFLQEELSNLLIAGNVELEGALYSVFCAEASKRPWTSLNE